MSMKTYTEFAAENEGRFFWSCDAGYIDGHDCLDVLAYASTGDMERDEDNTLAVARETVIDDTDEGVEKP